jgi:hypothetical protein
MTTDPDKTVDSAQTGARRPAEPASEGSPRRFNPFINEDDMFKVVLWAGGIVLAIVVLIVLVRTIT